MNDLEAQLGTTRDLKAILNSARALAKDGNNIELVIGEFRSASEDGIQIPQDEKDEILHIAYTNSVSTLVAYGKLLQAERKDAPALKAYERAKRWASLAHIEMPVDVLHAMHAIVLKQNVRNSQVELDNYIGSQAYATR